VDAVVSAEAARTLAPDDERVRRARLLLPDETSRLLALDRGALAIELDDERQRAEAPSRAAALSHRGEAVA
jgi:hypothetical protein